jgi:hypothetical protein
MLESPKKLTTESVACRAERQTNLWQEKQYQRVSWSAWRTRVAVHGADGQTGLRQTATVHSGDSAGRTTRRVRAAEEQRQRVSGSLRRTAEAVCVRGADGQTELE